MAAPMSMGAPGGAPIEFGAGPVKVADDSLRLAQFGPGAEVGGAGRLKRAQAGRFAVRRRAPQELEIAASPVEHLGPADVAVAGDDGLGLEGRQRLDGPPLSRSPIP